MDEAFFRKRITELRIKKGVSEYKMSRDLGHSNSYIQGIVTGRSWPSMAEFLYMCEYLAVTPKDFFDEQIENPELVNKVITGARQLKEKDLSVILSTIERLNERNE